MKDFRKIKTYPLGIRNNNPGNLRPGHDWVEMVGENKGFVVFSSIEYGLRALAMDLINKQLRGLDTVEKIINVYAPPEENNTKAYINAVCAHLGCMKDTKLFLNGSSIIFMIEAIIEHENGPVALSLISKEMIKTALALIPANLQAKLK